MKRQHQLHQLPVNVMACKKKVLPVNVMACRRVLVLWETYHHMPLVHLGTLHATMIGHMPRLRKLRASQSRHMPQLRKLRAILTNLLVPVHVMASWPARRRCCL